MRWIFSACWIVGLLGPTVLWIDPFALEVNQEDQTESGPYQGPATVKEARSRAFLMYELINGSLQVMHRDLFDDETPSAIPSSSLDDVFVEMKKSFQVELRWLTVDADVVNVDHQAKTEFEKKAVRELAKGTSYSENVGEGLYQFAGPIRLASQCLKCHVKNRTNTNPRTSGLVITIPMP
ncbi:hypothetical protein VN12_08555 [Pirellula sp. SH-Sr6A]|uniref:c-type heme family protein n=1 Tax=Pirellula sp. SH-Sr6A TaxID=1632865 RepID=UPI00078ECAB8|nr:DUF3365 domain-containing protein [Pirellula sp. SH-Sr6A]AMV32160.1 hypothetical protein VN12_08555 [Pirellula sp. SH-Sr6A]